MSAAKQNAKIFRVAAESLQYRTYAARKLFPSWEGQGVGQTSFKAACRTTHPLPLPRGECAVALSNRLRKSCNNLKTARELDMTRKTLAEKIERYRLDDC